MLGGIFQGFLQILFRVWTIGMFYFLNNRLFSWIKDSRTPRVKYHQISRSKQDKDEFMTDQDCKISLFTSRKNSWNNLIFMNFVHSRNSMHYCQRTVKFEKKQFDSRTNDSSKEITTKSNTLCPFNKVRSTLHQDQFVAIDFEGKGYLKSPYWQEIYSTDLDPFYCVASECEFVNPTAYKRYPCEGIMDKGIYFPTSVPDKMTYLYSKAFMDAEKRQNCFCKSATENVCNIMQHSDKQPPCLQEDMYFNPVIYKDDICETSMQQRKDKDSMERFNQVFPCPQKFVGMSEYVSKEKDLYCEELEGQEDGDEECHDQDEFLFSLCNSHSSESTMVKTIVNCKETFEHCISNSRENMHKEECILSKEMHCSSAASVDSGFQSFHSVNTTHTCLDFNGVTLYISDISYNKYGQVVAMTVGFGVMEDSSGESVFSDDDDDSDEEDSDLEDDEDESEMDDDICSDSDEDFIVFDTEQCDPNEHFCASSMDKVTVAVNLNTACPSFEVKISQSYSSPYICTLQVDGCPQRSKSKISSKVTSDVGSMVQSDHVQLDKINRVNNLRGKRDRCYDFESAKELNKVGTRKERQVFTKDVQAQKNDVEDNKERNSSAGTACVHKKKVQFENDVTVHRIVMWEYAYRQARLGPWKDLATNRAHFKRRIQEIAAVLEPVLVKKLDIMDFK